MEAQIFNSIIIRYIQVLIPKEIQFVSIIMNFLEGKVVRPTHWSQPTSQKSDRISYIHFYYNIIEQACYFLIGV